MKIPARDSRFLCQADVPSPILVTIANVTAEKLKSAKGEQQKFILHFTAGKPMVLNPLNRGRLIRAYGDESDHWRGKPVEVYVDPDVEMGGEIVGGIRLRIPKAPPAVVTQTAAVPPPAAAPSRLRPRRRQQRRGSAGAADGGRYRGAGSAAGFGAGRIRQVPDDGPPGRMRTPCAGIRLARPDRRRYFRRVRQGAGADRGTVAEQVAGDGLGPISSRDYFGKSEIIPAFDIDWRFQIE